ncbi:hypothetical protein ACFQY7_46895 [Actinomadura luteofluorescens]|uniref:hypothetical protein n=1 Tax=Actinomadura luteofluorescens TaxID=46163 RepID=UPI0036362EA8
MLEEQVHHQHEAAAADAGDDVGQSARAVAGVDGDDDDRREDGGAGDEVLRGLLGVVPEALDDPVAAEDQA